MDEFYTENGGDNEVYFGVPDGLEPLRSLFDSLGNAILNDVMHDGGNDRAI